MIYEAKIVGRYSGQYWIEIPVKYGRQAFGPIKAVPGIDPVLDEYVYVGQIPAADTFVILSGTPIPTATIEWTNVLGKPTTFVPSSHTHPWAQITGAPATYAPSAHSHAAADVSSGVLAAARLPAATASAQGAMSAADKAKLDAATSGATGSTLALRDSGGGGTFAQVAITATAPTIASHAARKDYVDAQVATRAASSHNHLWAQITDKPTTFAPATHSHSWDETTGKPATFAPSAHSHLWADLTDKPTSFTPATHSHSWAETTGKPTTFAPSAHGHAWGEITGTPATYAPSAHSHAWADITSKPTTFAPAAHNHDASDTTSGVFTAARIPVATASVHGAIPAADKAKLDAASTGYSTNSLVMTDGLGTIRGGIFYTNAAQSTLGVSLTRKDYVDAEVATRAASSHSHEWADLPGIIELDGTTDFNTLTTRNKYHQSQSAEAATNPNSPSTSAGLLDVETGGGSFVYQWYYEFGSAGKIFYRRKYGSTWYAWREIAYEGGWVNVSIASGYARQNTVNPQVRKIGTRVYMRWGWSNTGMSAFSSHNVGTLPAGYEPFQTSYFSIASSAADVNGIGVVWPDGHIDVKTNRALGAYFLFDGVSWDTV